MRSPLMLFAAAVVAASCSDAPTATLLEPASASFGEWDGDPPPPWVMVQGDASTESGSATYSAAFLVNPPGTAAWLRFKGGTGVTFSANAAIMETNGRLRGTGTMTVGGETYRLSSVTSFTYDASCATSPTTSCASFEGDGFSSARSTYTGQLAGRIGAPPGWDGGKPGGGNDGGEACIPEISDCGFIRP